MNINIYNYDVNSWNYVSYKIGNDEIIDPIKNFELNRESNSPVELLEYNINLMNMPRVMNIMAKQSSYGLNKLICMKASFNTIETTGDINIYRSGSIIKFYIPNENITEDFDSTIYVLDKTKNKLDPVAVIYKSDSQWLKNNIFDGKLLINDSIDEILHKRVFTVLITSGGDSNKVSEVNVHKMHKFNEHQGQSSLDMTDLREGTYISRLFQSILEHDKRLSCINGVIVSSDFTKYYMGMYTQYSDNYLVTAQDRDPIIANTSEGEENITYNWRLNNV